MHIVHVHIKVKPEKQEDFLAATIENARNSIQEEGIVQFDFIQQKEQPDHFILVEVYRTAEDQLAHRETTHYKKWKETVADMMAEPRVGIVFNNVFPPDHEWRN
jgi:quinol monooxygenase YgiN